MFLSSIIFASLVCPAPTHSSFDGLWTKEDKKIQAAAAEGCVTYFHNTSPCLKHIRRTEPQVYRVVCGALKKQEEI